MFLLTHAAAAASFAAHHCPDAGRRAGRFGLASLTMSDTSELELLSKLSASFWTSRRAQLQADMESKMRELDEFEARERALSSAPALDSAQAPQLLTSGSTELAAKVQQLSAELAAEKEKVSTLQAQLEAVKVENEVNLQKVLAFWVDKQASAPTLVAAAEPAPVTSAKPEAEAPAEVAVAVADLVPSASPVLDEAMSLRELRAKLLGYGMSTLGLKAELRARLERVMLDERQKHQAWDPATLQWRNAN